MNALLWLGAIVAFVVLVGLGLRALVNDAQTEEQLWPRGCGGGAQVDRAQEDCQ